MAGGREGIVTENVTPSAFVGSLGLCEASQQACRRFATSREKRLESPISKAL